MSFDLFMFCARNGHESTFKRELFEEIMGRDAINPHFPIERLTYADGSGSDVSGAERSIMDGASFNRPGGRIFYDRLWELADRTHSFLVWPDLGRSTAVTRADMLPHLFEGMAEDDNPPYVVKSGQELEYAIEYAIDPEDPPPVDDEFDVEFELLESSGRLSRARVDAAKGSADNQTAYEGRPARFDRYGIYACWDIRKDSPVQLGERLI